MVEWMKKLFKSDKTAILRSAAQNKYYIDKYKDFDKIIATAYQAKDKNGNFVDVNGIVPPLKIDNRQYFSVIDNQGETPHCAGYSVCGVIESLIWKRTGKLINLNADQVYARAKQIDNNFDDGTYLESAYKAALELGGLGQHSKDISLGFVYNVGTTDQLKQQVKRLLHKYEFLEAGFNITDKWYTAGKGTDYKIQLGGTCLGGHAVVIVGADEEGAYVANSWGKEWCAKGFCLVPWNVFKAQFIYLCYLQNCFNNWKE